MRVREMRQGRRIVIKEGAPGFFEPLVGQHGSIFRVSGRNARIHLDDGSRYDVDARWLDLETEGERPAEPEGLVAFKRKVAEVTRRYARDHNLCEVVDDFLNDLGVEKLPEQDMVITLRVPEDLFEYSSDADVSIEDVVADQLGEIFINALSYQRLDYIQNVEFADKEKDT